MVAYAKRMKRFKVAPDRANIPVGTHLLLSEFVSVNGNFGYRSAWMDDRTFTKKILLRH